MSGLSSVPWQPAFPNNVALQSRRTDGTPDDIARLDNFNQLLLGNPNLGTILRAAGYSIGVSQIQVKPYVSPQQAIVLSAPITLAHGLGAIPSGLMLVLVCITPQLNYVAGDQIRFTDDAGNNRGIQLSADATNVYISVGAQAPQITNKSGGSFTAITLANFKIIARAWP